MKLTKSYLRKLIKEELENSMKDLDGPAKIFMNSLGFLLPVEQKIQQYTTLFKLQNTLKPLVQKM